MTITSEQLGQRLAEHVHAVEVAIDEAKEAAQRYATADQGYKKAHATAFVQAEGAMDLRKATADEAAADARFELKEAESLWSVAMENARARRAILSAFQTWCRAHCQELELANTGPRTAA